MLNTTLCYVTRGSQVLMLHRVKKKADINKDKWIGIGGKFEGEESPDECLLREAKEETGLTLTSWQCRGVVTFLNDTCEGEYMYLFTADGLREALKGFDFTRSLDTMQELGLIDKPGADGKRAKLHRIHGRSMRLYAVTPDQEGAV